MSYDTKIAPKPGVPDDENADAEYVLNCVESFEQSIGGDFKKTIEDAYRQYRGFQEFRNSWEAAGPGERDGVLYDAKKTWGSNLHIPLSFRTVETQVPKAIAQRPKMLILPRSQKHEQNVENMRQLIDAQQEAIDFELRLQDVFRTGAIYGLGPSKVFWKTEYTMERTPKKKLLQKGYWLPEAKPVKKFDDPFFEAIDLWDFMWDPFGSEVENCRWMGHRLWLDHEAVLQRLQMQWATTSARKLTEDDVRKMGSTQRYDEAWQARMEASNLPSYSNARKGEQVHEVIEYHDGNRVLTILDRQTLVQSAENPMMGCMPFQVFRPTKVPNQMVGISEIEPIKHLNRELDLLRSQRRDAATVALCAGYIYDAAAIDEEDLVFGPAAAMAVRNGRPGDVIMPIPVKDVPGSSWQDENVIKGDVSSITGEVDQDPGAGSMQTATEAQLVQTGLSYRIGLKSRRFEVETVRHAARGWLYLNQRMILKTRQVLQPGQTTPDPETGRFMWFNVGPPELMGEMEIQPEGGAMAAKNIPQRRQDAQAFLALSDNPYIDSRAAMIQYLELMDVKDPESFLKQSDPPIPPKAFEILQQWGVDPQMLVDATKIAQSQDPQLAGPGPEEVDRMMASEQQQTPQ